LTKQKKDILILAAGKFLQVMVALASIRILTELLSEKEIGNYYLLLAFLTLPSFAFLNPLGQYYERHIIQWKDSGNIVNATNLLLSLRFGIILSSLFVVFAVYEIFEYDKYYSASEFLLFVFVLLKPEISRYLRLYQRGKTTRINPKFVLWQELSTIMTQSHVGMKGSKSLLGTSSGIPWVS
jgi:O-antigen/teichoic acid export membrane protein